MNMNNYKEYMTTEMLMGPNSARILEELYSSSHIPVSLVFISR